MDKILRERKVNEDLGILEKSTGAVEGTTTVKKKKITDVI